jgi:hypothetical protein
MIIEGFLNAIYSFLVSVVNLIPVVGDLPGWMDNTLNLLSYGLMFFPKDVFISLIATFVFWMVGHLSWSVIEWVYKKIPGVD